MACHIYVCLLDCWYMLLNQICEFNSSLLIVIVWKHQIIAHFTVLNSYSVCNTWKWLLLYYFNFSIQWRKSLIAAILLIWITINWLLHTVTYYCQVTCGSDVSIEKLQNARYYITISWYIRKKYFEVVCVHGWFERKCIVWGNCFVIHSKRHFRNWYCTTREAGWFDCVIVGNVRYIRHFLSVDSQSWCSLNNR